MWWDILKNAKLSAKGKGKTIDTSDFKIDIEDNDCNKQLKEWARKIKNYSLLLKERYYDSELMVKHFKVKEEYTEDNRKFFEIHQKQSSQKPPIFSNNPYLYEHTFFRYKPVPENVACKVIDMLKKSTTGYYDNIDKAEIDGYKIIFANIFSGSESREEFWLKRPGGFRESKLVRSLVGLVATSTRVSFESLAPTMKPVMNYTTWTVWVTLC